jgi:hypothetical protein
LRAERLKERRWKGDRKERGDRDITVRLTEWRKDAFTVASTSHNLDVAGTRLM